MNIGLKVTYLWHDTDALELRVTAENAEFRGTADVDVGTDALLEAATTLAGFPKNHLDKREVVFGAAGKKFAGGAIRLEFYCKDLAGHAAFRATIEGDYRDQEVAENATVHVDGEGNSGVGGFGYFGTKDRQFHLFLPPEVADYSISAICVEPETVWMGIDYFGEYGDSPAGVLRYDRNTHAVHKYDLPDAVYGLITSGDRLSVSSLG